MKIETLFNKSRYTEAGWSQLESDADFVKWLAALLDNDDFAYLVEMLDRRFPEAVRMISAKGEEKCSSHY